LGGAACRPTQTPKIDQFWERLLKNKVDAIALEPAFLIHSCPGIAAGFIQDG
jgi:hypothetical protein